MRTLAAIGAVTVGLAACQADDDQSANADADSDQVIVTEDDAGTIDPALTDLDLDSNAQAVDQAVNQTDQASDFDEQVGNLQD